MKYLKTYEIFGVEDPNKKRFNKLVSTLSKFAESEYNNVKDKIRIVFNPHGASEEVAYIMTSGLYIKVSIFYDNDIIIRIDKCSKSKIKDLIYKTVNMIEEESVEIQKLLKDQDSVRLKMENVDLFIEKLELMIAANKYNL